MLYMPGTRPQ
jgi:hypothetical protein